MAHDWGHVFRDVVGGFLGGGGGMNIPPLGLDEGVQFPNPTTTLPDGTIAPTHAPQGVAGCDGMAWAGGTPPKGYKVVNFCGRGVLRKVRRRRRRRLLTASDKADISYIVATTGKGQLAASLIHRSAQ